MGWIDLIEYSLYALLAGALWRTFPRRRAQPPRYVEVDIIEPDKHYPLIERK